MDFVGRAALSPPQHGNRFLMRRLDGKPPYFFGFLSIFFLLCHFLSESLEKSVYL